MFQLIANRDATGARRAVIADVKYAESLLQRNLHDNENDFRKNPKKALKASKKPARKPSTKKS
jgi:acid phosphatase family membrane protein YuiD